MTISLPISTAAIIAQTWHTMQSYRAGLSAGVGRGLAHRGVDELPDRGNVAAVITDMLFDHSREVAGLTPLQNIAETGRRHRARGITYEHYSGFGDNLSAVLTDLLGEQASRSLVAAWGDIYWAIVRSVSPGPGNTERAAPRRLGNSDSRIYLEAAR